jgi:hypothetical protein
LSFAGIADDHGLAAAEVEAGERVLVGHAAGQVQHVLERLGLGGVRIEAGAAEGGAERGGVDRDDRAQTGGLVVAVDDLLGSAGCEVRVGAHV